MYPLRLHAGNALADNVDIATRSRMMSRIRSVDTQPEVAVRRALHKLGVRLRLHRRDLPGKPDIVLPKHHAVVFVHGCFWHAHDCGLFRLPTTRREFWRRKFERNSERDREIEAALKTIGWRVAVVWECALGRMSALEPEQIASQIREWLLSGACSLTITQTSTSHPAADPRTT